jgi:hypothetical protein
VHREQRPRVGAAARQASRASGSASASSRRSASRRARQLALRADLLAQRLETGQASPPSTIATTTDSVPSARFQTAQRPCSRTACPLRVD